MAKKFSKKKIYCKKLQTVGKNDVWLVNGEYVRQVIDENFVAYDQHYHLHFIPRNEFWIDREMDTAEYHYFIDHLLLEQRLMDRGKCYHDALRQATLLERRERQKSAAAKKISRENGAEKIKKIHKKLIRKYSGRVKVWLVNGRLVRDLFLVEYAEGGHDKVYSFIPDKEIWIEDCLSRHERRFIILHELHERYLMAKEGKDYAHAHRGATIVEDYYRDHPEGLEKRIKEEMEKNNTL